MGRFLGSSERQVLLLAAVPAYLFHRRGAPGRRDRLKKDPELAGLSEELSQDSVAGVLLGVGRVQGWVASPFQNVRLPPGKPGSVSEGTEAPGGGRRLPCAQATFSLGCFWESEGTGYQEQLLTERWGPRLWDARAPTSPQLPTSKTDGGSS